MVVELNATAGVSDFDRAQCRVIGSGSAVLLAGNPAAEEMDPFIAAILRGSLDPPPTNAASTHQPSTRNHASQLDAQHASSLTDQGLMAGASDDAAAPPVISRQELSATATAAADSAGADNVAVQSPKPRLSLAEQMRQWKKT